MPSTELPYRYDLHVPASGRIELQVPLPAGSQVTVFVFEHGTVAADDLVAASESSIAFWDNPEDDEDWNDA